MLELISIVCGLILIVYLPVEATKVSNGWTRPSFKGTPQEFRTAYLKQVTYFMWLGIGLGVANLAVAPLNPEDGQWVFLVVGAAIWFGDAAVAYHFRGRLAQRLA